LVRERPMKQMKVKQLLTSFMGDSVKKLRGGSLDTKVIDMMRVHEYKFKYDFDKSTNPVRTESQVIDFGLDNFR
jgi:hypothetical protein